MVCKRIIIKGKVQGVYFRASAKEVAEGLGVVGEVRNMPDESVEVIAAGEKAKVNEMIEWCRVGPPSARVEEVVVEDMPIRNFDGFRIVRRWSL